MPGSDTALTVDRTYSDPGRHHRCKSRVRARAGRRGGASLCGEGAGRVGSEAQYRRTHRRPLRVGKVRGNPAARGRGATAGIRGEPALFHDGVARLSSPPESARCLPGPRDSRGLARGTATCGAPHCCCVPSLAAESQPAPCAPDALPRSKVGLGRRGRSGVESHAERAPSPRFAA